MTETEWLDIFGDNLADLLIDAGMSQRELAEETGLSEGAISSYINKRKIPNIKAIINIAKVLDVEVSEFVYFGEMIF